MVAVVAGMMMQIVAFFTLTFVRTVKQLRDAKYLDACENASQLRRHCRHPRSLF